MTLEELKIKWQEASLANQNEDYVRATDICRNIVAHHSKFPQAWYLLAAISVKFKQNVVATEYLETVTPLIGKNYDLQLEVARLWYLVENYTNAKKLYTTLPNGDSSPTVLSELGKCLWKLGDYAISIQVLEQANALGEQLSIYSIPLIKAYLSFGDKELAKKVCAEALEKHQDDKELFLYYLLILWDRGMHTQVLEKLPNDPEQNSHEMNFFCGFVCLVNSQDLRSEEFFHPTLQDANFRAKVRSLKEVYSRVGNKDSFFLTFNADVFKLAAGQCSDGDIYEFGTYRGRSTIILSQLFPEKKIYSFDSFEGLPEQWTPSEGPGSYSTKGEMPLVSLSNVKYVKGWYKDTLPEFFSTQRTMASLIHIDCDLYSSTIQALEELKPVIQKGTLIIFDDFYGYDGYEKHEYKAFYEFVDKYNVKSEMIGFAITGREVLFRITEI
ncbi:TylF/MycF/NovP-related O-methyltransferase [Kangiella sp. HZ709]|uniref:TylF/MycF/NovP-related O-methyltransferase n=1 Tax=Kangiella sp. HZ709 TaxID=2666328 RepID=UPI0012B10363|nr:TylF/MycF/NovP-related O-methyltransferase [Kangiella sp. HZ709]MRX26740.1 hypothetical protein [Kangiella sp. HZ709]